MTAGTRRNGISKFGLFNRNSQGGEQATQHPRAGSPADGYTGRHADPRSKTARKRVRVVPVAAVAAALVAGAAAYGLVAGTGHSQGADLSAAWPSPAA